jgi:multimeric flavodoxin WrbA
MSLKILGISGSPINNSNTDRAVKAVLEAAELKSEFVKLSEINVRPCMACKRCVKDNICKVEDDFPALAEKIKEAKALVIGAYCPYGNVDGFTKAFLERLWSMRHVKNLNRGKHVVIVVSGLATPGITPQEIAMNKSMSLDQVTTSIAREMRMENMKVIGNIKIRGNVPCLTCGEGTTCKMSGVPPLFGPGTKASSELCVRVEDQPEVWEKINRLGKKLHDRLS